MARIIAITNQKGGVGKTTTAINLAASLAANELRVLLIDIDPQGNATTGLGIQKDPDQLSSYHAFTTDTPLSEILQPTQCEGLTLVPADRNLVGTSMEMADLENREQRLKDKISVVRDNFDFVLIDCPPSLDLLTLNALVAADSVLIPIQCEFFALEGISQLIDTIDKVKEAFGHDLQIEGILLTMFDDRTSLAKQVANDLKDFFQDKVFQTVIPRSIRLAEAPSHGKPILLYDPRSKGAESYIKLAKELLTHEQATRQSTQSAG